MVLDSVRSMKFLKYLFIASLAVICFAYGYTSRWVGWFPDSIIQEASIAYRAAKEVFMPSVPQKTPDQAKQNTAPFPINVTAWDTSGAMSIKTKAMSPSHGKELIFVLGGETATLDGESKDGYLAWLVDRDGKVQHVWKNMPDLWKPLEKHSTITGNWAAYPVGGHLFPNGDILVSYQGVNVFPIGVGIAKFDKDANLLWKANGFYHHWFSVAEDGRIFTPAFEVNESPITFEDQAKSFVCRDGRIATDIIAILQPDGKLIKEIDLLEVFAKSEMLGQFTHEPSGLEINTCDPTHLNDIEIVTDEIAHTYDGLAPGDILVSCRTLNGIGVIAVDSERFRWFSSGAYHQQHSPRFSGDGKIVAFDNLGGKKSHGISRIVELDMVTNAARTVFPNKPKSELGHEFLSQTAGYIDVSPSDQRMLVSWTHQGLVSEIDKKTGELLWEMANIHPAGDKGAVVSVYTAKYVRELSFDLNRSTSQ